MTKTKSQKYVYVVTRNRRRIESVNYDKEADAEVRAEKLREVLKTFDSSDVKKVKVVKTNNPYSIR